MPAKFRPAKRSNSHILIGLFGRSGCGKTYSSLLLGRGIVGPSGKLGMVDTEGGRGELFADVDEIGGYAYQEMEAPFTPEKYLEAIEEAERQGIECLVVDSMSHVWEGIGGVIDQANENERKAGRAGINNWNKPKRALNKLILKIMQTRVHLIFGLRAKRKTRQFDVVEGGQKKTKVARDGFYTPKMDEEFISEMLCYAEQIGVDDPRGKVHALIVGKVTHYKVAEFFKDGMVPTLRMGELFGKWSKNSDFKISDKDTTPAAPVQRQEATTFSDRTDTPGRPQPEGHGFDDEDEWSPPDGWPTFARVGEWSTWSKTFLATADRRQAESWSAWWRDFWTALAEMAEQKKPLAIEAKAELQKVLNAAMKRQPKAKS